MSLLEAREVTKRFGGLVAVSKLNLAVEEHSITSIIGPNGAGKTTFFNCVTGFFRPEGGEIVLRGRSIGGLSPDRITPLGVSRTYQNIRLFANMTALENILVGQHTKLGASLPDVLLHTRLFFKEEREAREEANRLLRYVGLAGRGDLLARNLSYGDQRRLELGRALATKPSLLLLDEPTAGMNPRETQEDRKSVV